MKRLLLHVSFLTWYHLSRTCLNGMSCSCRMDPTIHGSYDGFTTDLQARTTIEIYTVGGTLLFQETLQMNTRFKQIVAEACIQIAKGWHVPQHCLRFVWQPPSRKDEIMWFVAQCCVQKLNDEDHERWAETGNHYGLCILIRQNMYHMEVSILLNAPTISHVTSRKPPGPPDLDLTRPRPD